MVIVVRAMLVVLVAVVVVCLFVVVKTQLNYIIYMPSQQQQGRVQI
jgi:hypothetical protein